MFSSPTFDVNAAMKTLVPALDLVGTFVFALSGAAAGVKRRLDLFGVLVRSFAAANSGGALGDQRSYREKAILGSQEIR